MTERDREWKLSAINPHDRYTLRSAMCAARQLPGRRPPLMRMLLYLHVNKKSDDDDEPYFYLKYVQITSNFRVFVSRLHPQRSLLHS